MTMLKVDPAYLNILCLCIDNFSLSNRVAWIRATGLFHAMEIMRVFNPSLPAANWKYLQSLRGCYQDNPNQDDQFGLVIHRLLLALDSDRSQIFQGLDDHAIRAAIFQNEGG